MTEEQAIEEMEPHNQPMRKNGSWKSFFRLSGVFMVSPYMD